MAVAVISGGSPFKNTKPYIINRLILIGNGFDLAHGFKTSYGDFILDYFNSIVEYFRINEKYEDLLFGIRYEESFSKKYTPKPIEFKNINEVKIFLNKLELGSRPRIDTIFHSVFFKQIFDNLNDLNWVDIENIYFEHLYKNRLKIEEIKKLNQQFGFLEQKLKEYLINLHIEKYNFSTSVFSKIFAEKIRKDDTSFLDGDMDPKSIYFLNFNYTSTIDNYFDQTKKQSKDLDLSHNYIHGELSNEDNPIIFGFGDELDEKYHQFENLKNNNLFSHIKSFKYSKTSNYHNLIRFVETNDFQVYVIGHSCGLSDRTMLNEIFEHNNCKSIKIFYHQNDDKNDDFLEKTYEISRHFRDKGAMRKKLVPKEKSEKIPIPKRLD